MIRKPTRLVRQEIGASVRSPARLPREVPPRCRYLIGPEDGAPNFAHASDSSWGKGEGCPGTPTKSSMSNTCSRGVPASGSADEVVEVEAGDVVYHPGAGGLTSTKC